MHDTFHFETQGAADAPFIIGAVPNPRDTPPRDDGYIGETEKNVLGSGVDMVDADAGASFFF